ncbi:MAG: CaiB/BaiF CoA transferase family protein [Bacillota bacterium]
MGALDNIKVLDFTRLLPGPFCTMLLGDLGADIIKVEERGRGDYAREILPGAYYSVNRNKRSIAVDLKTEAGKEIAGRLAEKCDVLVEGFRPGVAGRVGIDYRAVSRRNPAIVYCSISGYGQYGPYQPEPGHDVNYLSLAGAMSIPARVGGPPARSGLPVGDLASAMYAAVSILAALYHRKETGGGQYIDIAIADCVFSWASTRFGDIISGVDGTVHEEFSHVRATNDVFDTADGRQIAIGVLEEAFWANLCRGIGRPDLLEDERFKSDHLRYENSLELHRVLSGTFVKKTQREWLELLRPNNVPATPVNSLREAILDPHFRVRGMVGSVRLPYLDREIVQVPFAGKLSRTPAQIRRAPPFLGEHTGQILAEELGYSREKIKELKKSGVVATYD